jgi:hypothetical protein
LAKLLALAALARLQIISGTGVRQGWRVSNMCLRCIIFGQSRPIRSVAMQTSTRRATAVPVDAAAGKPARQPANRQGGTKVSDNALSTKLSDNTTLTGARKDIQPVPDEGEAFRAM